MLSLASLFQALFIFFDDEKHSFMMNGNLVPAREMFIIDCNIFVHWYYVFVCVFLNDVNEWSKNPSTKKPGIDWTYWRM